MDPRKDYLARLALDALGANSPSAQWASSAAEMTTQLHGSHAFSEFLEQPSVRTLQVSAVHSAGNGTSELVASTTVGLSSQAGTSASAGVVFTKRSSEMLTSENMPSAVMMTTLGASPLQALQLNIKQLYAPMLLQDPLWASKLDANTRRTLEALEGALESAIQLGDRQSGEDDATNILTPYDECQHWKMVDAGMMPAATADQRARARQFWDCLRPVADQLASFYELPAAEMAKLLHELNTTLDSLFQAGFKEVRRMQRVPSRDDAPVARPIASGGINNGSALTCAPLLM